MSEQHDDIIQQHERLLIVDFGSQVTKLIARRVREAGLPVKISHLKLGMNRYWGDAARLIDVLDTARASGVDITADIYPYQAWQTSFQWLVTLFPERDLDRRDGAEYILTEML